VRHTLSLLEGRSPATARCTYCPKLCRPACPVSTAEGRETVTPWGKMRALDEVLRDAHPGHEAERFEKSWACTGCGACRELCLLDNPVADTLWDGRADAFANGLAPEPARTVAADFPARLQRLADASRALGFSADGATGADAATTVVLPGCTAVATDPDEARDAVRAVEGLTGCPCGVEAGTCCGAPLYDAGDRVAFAAQARAFAARVAGAGRVVTPDAGCAFVLRVVYPSLHLTLPPVLHLSELAAEHLPQLQPLDEPRTVAVHDSCKLGRGLGVYEAPRTVLTHLLGRAPAELGAHRAHGLCSGGGGLLPVTRPDTSRAIAEALAAEVAETVPGDDAVVVTGCLTSARQLRAAGTAAETLTRFVARAVTPPPSGEEG
jgi:Fe-S oxidoreductase